MMQSASLFLILSDDIIDIDMNTRTGKIYKIVCSKSNDVYVGSTFNALRTRMSQHKTGTLTTYPHVVKHGWKSLKMILITEYQVVDRKHLMMYETLWINKLKACNMNVAFQILNHNHIPLRNTKEQKNKKKKQQQEQRARENCENREMTAHDKPAKPSETDAFLLKENKIIYKQYWEDRSKVMRKYVSGKVPRGAKKLLDIENNSIVGKMLNHRGYMTIQQVIDHDKNVLKSRE